ncbi:MAG: hypothetical protein ACFFB3_09250, partial [Candidatus Hodarchaeota archaeon]
LNFQGHIRYDLQKAWALMEYAGYDMTPFREVWRRQEAGERAETALDPVVLILGSVLTVAGVGVSLALVRRYWEQHVAPEPETLQRSRQWKRVQDAIALKKSPRMSEKVQAQELFQQLAKDETLAPNLVIYSMLNLCDLLMGEVKAYGEQAVYLEAQRLSDQIYNIAQEQGSSAVLIEALVLRSKFALLEGNIAKADKLLKQAAVTANEKRLSKFAEKVTQEQFAMEKEYEEWEQLIADAAPIRDRLEYSRLQNYIASAVKVLEQEEAITGSSTASKDYYS